MSNFGDRLGNYVFMKHPLVPTGGWFDVTTGEQVHLTPATQAGSEKVGVFPLSNSKPKERFVKLYRYVRPYDYDGYDARQGTTFYIELDYDEKTINFALSVCSGENFEKSVGRHIAYNRFQSGYIITIPMKNGKISEAGVLYDIWDWLKDVEVPSASLLHKVRQQFFDAEYF